MNYLAHLALSDEHPEIMVGNLMGDFMTRKQIQLLPFNFQLGYELHLFIDQYTDKHLVVDEICNILKPSQDKYTPVVVDIIFDYFLYENWYSYYSINFGSFEELAYDSLRNAAELIPSKVNYRISRMVEGEFIQSYKSLNALHYVLERMDKRTRFPSNFTDAIKVIEDNKLFINDRFRYFYQDLKEQSEKRLINLQSEMIS